MKGYWIHRDQRALRSLDQLRALIQEVRALGSPTMIFLEEEASGATFVFGVGHPDTVLTYALADGSSFHSMGDLGRTGYLKFWSNDALEEFFAEMAIPEADGIAAAEEFFTTRKLPTAVEWEPDW